MEQILAVDVGGAHVKLLLAGETEPRRFDSGPELTAKQMVDGVKAAAEGWDYEAVTVGIPAPVHHGRLAVDPVNLGHGWTGFDFEAGFGKPTLVVNDAAMQAVGSYDGGRMLFLGLGTGLGSAVIDEGLVEPLELGHLPFREKTFEDYVGTAGFDELGRERWRDAVLETLDHFHRALEPDYIVLGGGNVAQMGDLPAYVRPGDNENAFTGGFRLWQKPDTIPTERLLVFRV